MKKTKIGNIPFGPFATVLAGASVDGKANYATVGAYGVVCQDPILYISLKSTHHTTKGVKESGYFSVNIPTTECVSRVDFCGLASGNQTDKSAVFTSFFDPAGDAPMIEECSVNYLCKVINTIPLFGFDMFLGEIVAAYAAEDCLVDGRLNALAVDPIIMMDRGYFSLGGKIGTAFQSGRNYTNGKGDSTDASGS